MRRQCRRRGRVHAPGVDGAGCDKADKGRGRGRGKEGLRRGRGPAAGRLPSLLAATPGPSGAVAAVSWFLQVLVWRCHARLPTVLACFLKFSDDCSHVGRRLSPRDGSIIREMNESVFALNLLKTGGIGLSESCEQVEYSILSTDLASPALRRLHFVISDFRPPSVAESGEVALRRLLASRAIGGYSLPSDDPAPGSLPGVPVIASCFADMETWLAPAKRYVDLVVPHSRLHYASVLVKACSVGFVESAAEHVGLFFVAKEFAQATDIF